MVKVYFVFVNKLWNPNAQVFDESTADGFEMGLVRATPEEKETCLKN